MSIGKTILGIFILLVATGAGVIGYIYAQLQPVEITESEQPVVLTIPDGSSTRYIGRLLEDENLVRNGRFFSYYVRLEDSGQALQAGQYRFKAGMTLDQIIKILKNGETYIETFTVTIPEGYTVEQIAKYLADKDLVNYDTFMREVRDGNFSFEFIKNIPDSADIRHRLEGYLFPETYEFPKDTNEHEMIERLLQQFDRAFKDEWKEALQDRSLTLHQAVTMASLVERETVVDKERAKVAGVLFNRLDDGMPLQIDASVRYVHQKFEEPLTTQELEVDHPFNTYEVAGFPPGPIASPGRKALQSIISPEDHHFKYYVTKKDGTREHYFSKTYQEHLNKKALSEENENGQ